MEGTQILNRTTDSIARSHQISAETDQIGVETIDELGRQREVLERTRDRVKFSSLCVLLVLKQYTCVFYIPVPIY